MAINRFYKPSASNYQSQFVPEKIPFDAMAMALTNKQKAEDVAVENTNKLGLWDNPALPGMDTYYRDQYKKGIEGFIDESFGVEQSSPEFQRKYINKVREIRDNPELKKITSNYNAHQSYLKTIEDYKKDPNTFSYAEELEHEYNQRYNNYTKSVEAGGMGFKGSIGLGDPTILRGTDINKEGEELFNHIKASGSESIGFLEEGLAYKNGWSSVSGQTIENQTIRLLDQWVSSPAGKQLGDRWDMRNFPKEIPSVAISKMSPEEKKEYFNKRNTYIGNELLNIGKGFQHSQYTTDADAAYRQRWGVGQERLNLYPTPQIMNVAGNTAPFVRDYEKDSQQQIQIQSKMDKLSFGIDNYEKAKANPNANPQYYKLSQVSPQTVEAWKAQRHILQQEQKEFKTRESNAVKKAYVALDNKIDPKYVDEFGEFKLKYTPFNSGSIPMQELSAYHDEFIKAYDKIASSTPMRQIKASGQNMFGQDIDFTSEISTIKELRDVYDNGLKKIENLRKVLGDSISSDDKKALDYYEQNFRINTANIFSHIPQTLTTKSVAYRGVFGGGEDITVTNPYVGKQAFDAAKKANYSDVGSWTPNSQLRDPDTVVLVDAAGNAGKPVESADKMAEKFVGLYPQQNIVMLGNEIIEPGDPRYPLADGKARVVSSNVDKSNNDNTPILQVNYNYKSKVAKPVYDDDGTVKYTKEEDGISQQTYTIVMSGANANQYNQMKANQLKSDIIKNPNDMQNAVRYINMSKFQDANLSSDLTEISRLKLGETYTTEIGDYNNNSHLTIDVKRSSIDDSWDVIVTDPDTGERTKTNLPNAKDAANYYRTIYNNGR